MLCTFDEVFFNVIDNLTVKIVAVGKILYYDPQTIIARKKG